MELADLAIIAGDDFRVPDFITVRLAHICEAIRMTIARNKPIEAPFEKIILYIVNVETTTDDVGPHRILCNGILEVYIPGSEEKLTAEYTTFKEYVCKAIIESIRGVFQDYSLDILIIGQSVEFIRDMKDGAVFHLNEMSIDDKKNQLHIDVYYEITERISRVYVVVMNKKIGFSKQIVVAHQDKPISMSHYFPVTKTTMVDKSLIFLDGAGRHLADVSLEGV